jgi:hypothetical protein
MNKARFEVSNNFSKSLFTTKGYPALILLLASLTASCEPKPKSIAAVRKGSFENRGHFF